MGYGPEVIRKVRAAYVRDCLPLEQAAVREGVGPRTAARWKAKAQEEGDDWDRARTAARLSGENLEQINQALLEQFLTFHQATMEEVQKDLKMKAGDKVAAISRLADAFNKTMNAVSKSAPELSRLAVASDVLQRLGRYVAEHHPAHASMFLEVLEPFGEELVKAYG